MYSLLTLNLHTLRNLLKRIEQFWKILGKYRMLDENMWGLKIQTGIIHYIRGLPLITYAPRGRGGGQVSHTFLLRITCKKGGRWSR